MHDGVHLPDACAFGRRRPRQAQAMMQAAAFRFAPVHRLAGAGGRGFLIIFGQKACFWGLRGSGPIRGYNWMPPAPEQPATSFLLPYLTSGFQKIKQTQSFTLLSL